MSASPVVLDDPYTGETYTPAEGLDITSIEAAIVTQLQNFLAASLGPNLVEVTHFPDKPEAYEMRHRIGVAMVIYNGSKYSEILDIGKVIQDRTMEFAVGVRIRDLGWNFGGQPSGISPGAYQVLEAMRAGLLGFQVNKGCSPIKAVSEEFIDRDRQGGVWVYELKINTITRVIENYTPPAFPLFTQGTGQEQGGQSNIAVGLAQLTFSGSPGSINLGRGNISAVIVKSTNLATTYVLGTDYSLDTVNGVINRLATGTIGPNATVAVSFAYADQWNALASGGEVPFAPNN